MNSKYFVETLPVNGVWMFKILVRSPRRNFIENALRAMIKNKQKNAVSRNIQEKTFKQFYNRAMT